MANMDAHFPTKTPADQAAASALSGGKWSGRRTIAVALVASGAMWVLIFYVAKALIG